MVMGRSSSVRRPSGRMGRVLYVKRRAGERRKRLGDLCSPQVSKRRTCRAGAALVRRGENSRNSRSRKACSILKIFPAGPAKTVDRESSNSTREPNLNRVIPADARAGTTVGKYKLHEIVGRGGM